LILQTFYSNIINCII